MSALVVDTSSWISYFRGDTNDVIDRALHEGRIYLPVIVVAELLSAKLSLVERTKLTEFLRELPLCDHSFSHWMRTGELRAKLAKKGFHVSTPDAHVAQSALDLNAYLLSEDAIFAKVANGIGLKV